MAQLLGHQKGTGGIIDRIDRPSDLGVFSTGGGRAPDLGDDALDAFRRLGDRTFRTSAIPAQSPLDLQIFVGDNFERTVDGQSPREGAARGEKGDQRQC